MIEEDEEDEDEEEEEEDEDEYVLPECPSRQCG